MKLFWHPKTDKLNGNQNIEGLIKTLGNKKYADVRWQSAKALGDIGDKRALHPLIETLDDEHEYVRQCTAEALGKIGDGRATEKLITVLKDKDLDVRISAANALGKIGDKRATEPLIIALQDKDPDIRSSAANALGQIGDDKAIEPLIDTLNDQNHTVRENAANALEKLGWKPDRGQAEAFKWIAKRQWDRCIEIGAPAVQPLISVLEDKDARVRKSAVNALGQIGDASVVEPLISAFRDKSEIVRRAAVEALAKIGKDLTVEALIAALKNDNALVRRNAAYTLCKIGDDRAIEPLIEALKDRRKEVEVEVISEIAELGLNTEEIRVELVNKLADRKKEVRFQSAKAFWKLKKVDWAIQSLREEYRNQAHMPREETLRGFIALLETADRQSDFEKLLAENWPNRQRSVLDQIIILEYIRDLSSLETTIFELPKKFPPGNIPSDMQPTLSQLYTKDLNTIRMQFPIICKKIIEVQQFLESFFDASIIPSKSDPTNVQKNVILNDLKVLIETTRQPAYFALMLKELNSEGVEVFKNCIDELEQISIRIPAINGPIC